jgi:hypothetical protein
VSTFCTVDNSILIASACIYKAYETIHSCYTVHMYPEEKLTPAQIAQEARKQEVAARRAFEERERENRERREQEKREYEEKLIREQEQEREQEIEEKRQKLEIESEQEQQRIILEQQEQELLENQKAEEDEYLEEEIEQTQQEDIEQENQTEEELGEEGEAGGEKKWKNGAPRFPGVMLSLALVKDLFDLILALTIVLKVLAPIISIPYNICLFMWTRSGNKFGSTQLQSSAKSKIILTMFFETIPFVDIVPLATWYVLNTHHRRVADYKKHHKK